MITSDFTTQMIKAEEGKYLTQVSDVDIKDRIVVDIIYLSSKDFASNYKEISKLEGDNIRLKQKELYEKEEQDKREEEELKRLEKLAAESYIIQQENK